MGLYVLAVHHPRNGRDIESCFLCYILENHRLQVGLISIHEIVVLIVDDCLHRAFECIVPLLDCLHEPFRRIQLLFDEHRGILLFPLRRIGSFHKDVCIFLVHPEFRNGKTRNRQDKFTILEIENEVRYNLLSLIVV